MEQKLQTSFIPKAPIAVLPQRRGIGLLFLASLILFLLSAILAGGAFAYQQYFANQSATESAQFAQAAQQFQPSTIQTLQRLDERINASKALLAAHISAPSLFSALSAATLSTVSFSDFKMAPDGNNGFAVVLQGEAQSYQALALESDALSSSGVFTAPVFSNVSLDTAGQVTFTLSASVPESSLLYSSALSGLPVGLPVGSAATTTASSTAP